ncbi:MAG: tRNA lysidine(34) synthetase TilS [Candidatus Izemoplasma sp.]|nr:tRNA lysidine(34) synthetase TilS [Candidatus Izemoplasma sp.]
MKSISEHVKQLNLFSKDSPVVVAVSTGVDSMVLLHVLLSLDIKCIVAHVNHQKRKQSNEEQAFLKAFSKHHNVPFKTINITLENRNFQKQAREKRYHFFKQVAKQYHTHDIALAHHLDDQAETIMMRIIRGSSFQGYEGMHTHYIENDYRFIRPLLNISKDALMNYAQTYNIHYYDDYTNQSSTYTRNRIRHDILPLMAKENPQYRDKLLQLSEYIKMANEMIHPYVTSFLDQHYLNNKISLIPFNNLKDIVKINVLTHLINDLTDNKVEISYNQYQTMISLALKENPNQEYALSKDYKFIKTYTYITLIKTRKERVASVKITDEGCYQINDHYSFFVTHNKLDQNHRNFFQLWYNELVFPLYLRTRQNGDKMILNVGTKKVKDIFIDQKIPKHLRDTKILLANDDDVLWIPGIKKAHQDQSKKHILYIYEVTKC